MSVDAVRHFFEKNNYDYKIIEFDESTATVELAAEAVGVKPELIAKTMAFKLSDRNILIILKGDGRVDNRKYKDIFKTKAKMLSADEVLEATGHAVGGVCPFGLNTNMDIYLDNSLKQFEYIYPAAGSANSAVKIKPLELEMTTKGKWIDVIK